MASNQSSLKIIILIYFTIISSYSNSNPIDDVLLFSNSENLYNFFVEIPAGSNQKWEVDKKTGKLEWEEKKGEKRVINFLPYPGNYGFLPQTLSGDGDAIDFLSLDESLNRGEIVEVKIIGGLYFEDKKEIDYKLIGFTKLSPLFKFNSIEELFKEKPQVLNIIKIWFESYKKPGKMIFYRYIDQTEALQIIQEGHERWNAKNIN